MVSCLIQINTNSKANWMYPETAAISYMPKDQIIMNSLIVEYSCVTIIRCRIGESLIKDLNCQFVEKMNKLIL